MQSLLITGADGFVGRHMVTNALKKGWKVTALVHNTQSLAYLQNPQLSVEEWRINNLDSVKPCFQDMDVVVHLAAFIPSNFHDPRFTAQCFEVNALGTQSVLQAAIESEVSRFINYSSGNTYAPLDRLAKESDPLYPARRAPYYLTSKIAGEVFCEHYRLTYNLPTTTLRLSSVYGPSMRSNEVLPIFIQRARSKQPIEVNDGGRHRVDFVNVQDVIQATFRVIEVGADGIFNIGSGQQTSILELAKIVLDSCDANHDLLRIHPPSGEYHDAFAGLDIEKARTILNYSPMTLEAGVRHFIENEAI